MEVLRLPAGPLETNGYLIHNGTEAVAIDPSLDSHDMIAAIKENNLKLLAILQTHFHFDHFLGIYELFDEFGNVPLYIHPAEKVLMENSEWNGSEMIAMPRTFNDEYIELSEGDLSVGPFTFQVIHLPGHTPGGVAFYDGTNCFTGDSLFADSVGRTDWQYSSTEDLLNSIREKLFKLPDDTVVWPGHFMRTTIGREKRHNPFL